MDAKDELIIKMGDELLRMSQHLSKVAEKRMPPRPPDISLVSSEDLIKEFLERHLPESPDRDGMRDTPKRFVKAFLEMTSGYHVKVADLFTVFEKGTYDQMIVVRGIDFTSLCEHHFLPFKGVAHVGYLPSDKIVGLSKLARVVDAFSRRAQVQERLTTDIADAITEHLKPTGVGVLVEAHHECMSCRGVRKANAVMVTSALYGTFRTEPETRAEFLTLARGP